MIKTNKTINENRLTFNGQEWIVGEPLEEYRSKDGIEWKVKRRMNIYKLFLFVLKLKTNFCCRKKPN